MTRNSSVAWPDPGCAEEVAVASTAGVGPPTGAVGERGVGTGVAVLAEPPQAIKNNTKAIPAINNIFKRATLIFRFLPKLKKLLLLEKVPDPVGHGLSVVHVVQQNYVPVPIALEEPLVEGLPRPEGTTACVPGQTE